MSPVLKLEIDRSNQRSSTIETSSSNKSWANSTFVLSPAFSCFSLCPGLALHPLDEQFGQTAAAVPRRFRAHSEMGPNQHSQRTPHFLYPLVPQCWCIPLILGTKPWSLHASWPWILINIARLTQAKYVSTYISIYISIYTHISIYRFPSYPYVYMAYIYILTSTSTCCTFSQSHVSAMFWLPARHESGPFCRASGKQAAATSIAQGLGSMSRSVSHHPTLGDISSPRDIWRGGMFKILKKGHLPSTVVQPSSHGDKSVRNLDGDSDWFMDFDL